MIVIFLKVVFKLKYYVCQRILKLKCIKFKGENTKKNFQINRGYNEPTKSVTNTYNHPILEHYGHKQKVTL